MRVEEVAYNHEDRQWDARFNVQSDESLVTLTERVMEQYGSGKLKYVLIGGVEIGTQPTHTDYKVRHVHVAAIFENRTSKASILRNWGITEGNGYYLVPRNRDLPYKGWRDHHAKVETKVDPNSTIIFEGGTLPKDAGEKRKIERSDLEKKITTDEAIRQVKRRLEAQEDEHKIADDLPRIWMQYGEKLKTMINQKKPDAVRNDPHMWVWGFAGTGKTLVLEFIYPERYKKDLNNQFMDLYDPKFHTHIMLEDYDHATAEKLGIQFLKTLCDEAGFPVNQKYKGGFLANTTVLVTSQFKINDIIPEGKGVEETRAALHRRFLQICVSDLLRLLGLKLIPKYERQQLKYAKNTDTSKLFMCWDYQQGMPTGQDVQKPEYYRAMILKYIYG